MRVHFYSKFSLFDQLFSHTSQFKPSASMISKLLSMMFYHSNSTIVVAISARDVTISAIAITISAIGIAFSMISAAIRQRLQHTIVNCFTLLFSLCIFAFSPLHSLIAYADGWSLDESTGIWTYVQLHTDGPGYSLKKGWHDDIDGYKYYLHDETGHMLIGYHVIGDKLCYFKDEPNQENYRQHEDSFWYY